MKRALTILLALLLAGAVWGDTHTANSMSYADVNDALTLCSDGDTLNIPAGTAIWASTLTVSKPISIIGAGSMTGGTKLISTAPMTNGFFEVTGITSTQLMRIGGIFFEMTDFSSAIAIYVHNVTMDNIRIDHNTFNHGNKPIAFYNPKGLIDNNYFYNGNLTIEFAVGWGAQAAGTWASMAAGTAEALFIEDNYFIDDANFTASYINERVGSMNGGKLVVRYNHFDSTALSTSQVAESPVPIMTHGNAGQGAEHGYWQIGTGAGRAPSVTEIYQNTIAGNRIEFPIILRGSANLVHDNTITMVSGVGNFYMYEEEYMEGETFDPLRIAWPAEDQVHNSFFWNNTVNGVPMDSSKFTIGPDGTKIVLNQDYFVHRPATIGEGMTLGKETFTGSNGASNTYPTDGDTYPTLGTMVFTPGVENAYYGYAAYTYPHPLRGENVSYFLGRTP